MWTSCVCVCGQVVREQVVCVCVDHLNRCKTSYMQGATLPVTREWPTKSLVSGTENVPAFAVHGRRRAQLGGNYIYIYIYIYLYICT